MTDADFEFFFTDPAATFPNTGRFSALYLLRRDINRCAALDEGFWLGTMGVFAGIELLATFFAGRDTLRGAPNPCDRFKKFVVRYFGLTEHSAGILYEARKGLMHSFGLYAGDRRMTRRVSFAPGSDCEHDLIMEERVNYYQIDLSALRCHFESAIDSYAKDLRSDQELQRLFDSMFPKYGRAQIALVP